MRKKEKKEKEIVGMMRENDRVGVNVVCMSACTRNINIYSFKMILVLLGSHIDSSHCLAPMMNHPLYSTCHI